MTLQEAIEARHSVRAYKNEPLADEVVKVLEEQIAVLNREGKLHMQLILNEPKAFQGTMAKYGKFRNANNYIVMAGKKADDLDERIGYYGEHLVLSAQTLGLNTCWVGLSYSKVPGTYELGEGEHHDHLVCLKCGKVVEFVDPDIEKAQAVVAERYGYELCEHTMVLYGLCESCRKAVR